jgi:hypothetical protein
VPGRRKHFTERSMMSLFVSFLGVLIITLVVFLVIWALGRITLGP